MGAGKAPDRTTTFKEEIKYAPPWRSPERSVSVIRYEQANETMAMTMTNAATEYKTSGYGHERGADQRRHASEDRGELVGQ